MVGVHVVFCRSIFLSFSSFLFFLSFLFSVVLSMHINFHEVFTLLLVSASKTTGAKYIQYQAPMQNLKKKVTFHCGKTFSGKMLHPLCTRMRFGGNFYRRKCIAIQYGAKAQCPVIQLTLCLEHICLIPLK